MKKLNLRKLQHVAGLALKNGIRLHFDSIVLYKNKSYPSAFFLSVIAMEEIGKAFSSDDFSWYSKINGRKEDELEKSWIDSLFGNHKLKQLGFLRQSNIKMSEKKKYYSFVQSKELDREKQDAIYVGIRKPDKSNVRTDGEIINPIQFSSRKCLKQINLIQNFLVDEIEGISKGSIYHDLAVFRKILSPVLLDKLIQQKIN